MSNIDSGKYEENDGYQDDEAADPRPVHEMSPSIHMTGTRNVILKLRYYSVFAVIMGTLTIVIGAATLGFAAENLAYNYGPLLLGITVLFGGYVGMRGTSKLTTDNEITPAVVLSAQRALKVVHGVCFVALFLALVSCVWAFMLGAMCAGIPLYTRNGNTRTRIDVKQYCSPNNTANTVLGFVGGIMCSIIVIWVILIFMFFCCYSRYLGVEPRRRRTDDVAILAHLFL